LDRIAVFCRINRIGVNHDNPEKSRHPVKNNGWFLIHHGGYGEHGVLFNKTIFHTSVFSVVN
jgi:hypothetical protein